MGQKRRFSFHDSVFIDYLAAFTCGVVIILEFIIKFFI